MRSRNKCDRFLLKRLVSELFMKGGYLMVDYDFIASNEKLPTFEEVLVEEELKSYNDLLKLGLTEEQIQIIGIDLKKMDHNKNVFLIQLPEELQNSPLVIEEDFRNSYARFLTDKKFIYKVTDVERAVSHLAVYIGMYANTWKEIELWRVLEDDYTVDYLTIAQSIINIRNLTIEHLESFYEASNPKLLKIVQI